MRIFLTWFATLAFAVSPSNAAQSYVDPKYGFRIAFPDAWLVASESADGGMVAGVLKEPRTVCVAAVTENEATKASAQLALDTEMLQPFGLDFWRSQAFADGSNITIESHGARLHSSGRPVQEAIVSEPASPSDPARRASMVSIFATPGLVHLVLCTTASSSFAAMKPTMTNIADSYRPGPTPAISVSAVATHHDSGRVDAAVAAIVGAKAAIAKAWSR